MYAYKKTPTHTYIYPNTITHLYKATKEHIYKYKHILTLTHSDT